MKQTRAPVLVVLIQIFIQKHFEDSRLEKPQFSCNKAWASPRLAFHSCSTAFPLAGVTLHGAWTSCCDCCRRPEQRSAYYDASSTITHIEAYKHAAIFIVYLFQDHSIKMSTLLTTCLDDINKALHRLDSSAGE